MPRTAARRKEMPDPDPRSANLTPLYKDASPQSTTARPPMSNWIDTVKHSCQSCHALGSKGIRTVPEMFAKSGDGFQAWARRTQSGQAMTNMALSLGNMGAERALKSFADWTDRIAAGELPFAKPERPKGIERNLVVRRDRER